MKAKTYLLSFWLALSLSASATLYQSGNLSGAAIPDNSTVGTGGSLSYTFSGPDDNITGLTLGFTLQGGIVTDLTGYLRLGNEATSPSFNLTSVIGSQSLSQGAPVTYSVSFDNNTAFRDTFTRQNPNKTWTLFFADTSPAGNTVVNGWSLDITAVPEPVNVALAVFGVGAVGVGFVRRKMCSEVRERNQE